MELKLVLPVPVSINALYINQYRYNPKNRKREPTGAKILSKAGEKSKAHIQIEARDQMEDQTTWDFDWTAGKDNFVYQDAVIYFSRRGRDDNNIYKLLNDSLEGIAYENDSRVLVRTQKILYDVNNPRIELTITPVEYVGVFENIAEANIFEEGCTTCTRYLDSRCSILVDSKRGSVRPEISVDGTSIVCEKFKKKK